MGRTAIRTETATLELTKQILDYIKAEHTTLTGYHSRFLPHLSYQMFRLAVLGAPSTAEMLDEINNSLDEAQREQIRRDRKTCPHCKTPLD